MEGLGVIALRAVAHHGLRAPALRAFHHSRGSTESTRYGQGTDAERLAIAPLRIGSDSWLLREQRNGLPNVFGDRAWCGWAVLPPPLGSTRYLRCRPCGDLDAQCHARELLRELGQQLLESYELSAPNLRHRCKKLVFLRGGQTERFVRATRDHCDESAFPKRNALDDDFTVDNGASCDLHGPYRTPPRQLTVRL